MAGYLKQRLVGAFVLLAGILILWPLVFDDPYSSQVDVRTQIPPEPAIETPVIPDPQPIHDDLPLETGRFAPLPDPQASEPQPAPVPVAQPQVSAEPAKPATTKPVLPATTSDGQSMKLDARGLPERWTVQVGSFKDESSALALKKRLVAKGYPAYVKSAQASGATYVRVFVGPKVDRAAAESVQQAVNREFKLKSIVVHYDP